MAERIKQIPKKLLEIWNNWTKKQKTVIVSAVAVFLVAVVILAVVLNQPNYQVLTTCKDYTELSEVTALLKSNSYDYKVADNSLIVQVPKAKLTDAKMLPCQNTWRSPQSSLAKGKGSLEELPQLGMRMG